MYSYTIETAYVILCFHRNIVHIIIYQANKCCSSNIDKQLSLPYSR